MPPGKVIWSISVLAQSRDRAPEMRWGERQQDKEKGEETHGCPMALTVPPGISGIWLSLGSRQLAGRGLC